MIFEDQIYVNDNTIKFCAVCRMNKTVMERNLLNLEKNSIGNYNEITFVGINFDTA